ncbi:8-oxoguanine-DNA-glycosylase [Desulfurella amilsii]|uniref:DNA-(apurinic or apyrimidinic site) lyase n=1 Tax=Desulfurella amilsii TaxID=1562698 RepID=A0A1X4Y036_9BACT|nr:DNA glycosylase [Desulfurella amilsii]OSS43159.1 8-oxoguanine-DNA-glycosylase [Desulfurella amilsii]
MNKIKVPFKFNLEYTLESGQIFRISKINDGYRIFSSVIFDVYFDGNYLYYNNADENYIKRFFSLDIDFDKIIEQISVDKYIKKAVKAFEGLVILTQNPYEATVSFICSAFNNIKRIRLMLDRMCTVYGNQTGLGYTFPVCGVDFDENKLQNCGFGFRKKYIAQLQKSKEFFYYLHNLDTNFAKKELMGIKGIGSKVADCILLFAYRRYEVFCTDVWIKRIIEKLYFNDTKQSVRIIEEFGKDYFGKYAGVAQQYLFLAAKKGVI